MPIKVYYSDKFKDSGIAMWDFHSGHSNVLHLEQYHPENGDPFYGITWHTRIPTQKGLAAIRDSYQRLRETVVEARELSSMGRCPLVEYDPESPTSLVGPVTFALEERISSLEKHADAADYFVSGPPRSVMDLSDFLNPDSFKNKDGVKRDPLRWIRADTQYLSYYFQGEIFRGRREFGVIGLHNAADEILRLFSETSSRRLSPDESTEVSGKMRDLLRLYPKFAKR
ncbi:hypothetical protein HYX10_01945 [Candidatus Woesearchaeota archaeon]|nr:hypothetical protein [Candidatus Woesearchaeota archaeon]